MDTQQQVKVLERAAELVERGWCRLSLGRIGSAAVALEDLAQADSFCAVGAITLATHEITGRPMHGAAGLIDMTLDRERVGVMDMVAKTLGIRRHYLSDWNDGHCMDGSQVADVFRVTAEQYK